MLRCRATRAWRIKKLSALSDPPREASRWPRGCTLFPREVQAILFGVQAILVGEQAILVGEQVRADRFHQGGFPQIMLDAVVFTNDVCCI